MPKLTVIGVDPSRTSERENVYELLCKHDPKLVGGPSPRGSSYYKSLLDCPHEHGLRHDAGLTPENPTEALTVGWLFHVCLQYYYQAIADHQRNSPNRPSDPSWLWGGCNKGMADAYAVLDVLREAGGYKDTADVLQLLLDGYFDRYDRADKWRIVAIEETLFHHSLNYSARLDLLIHDLDRNALFVTEHKSARMITDDLLDNYQLDLQILGQAWLVEKCMDLSKYPPFFGVRINIATKHKSGSQTVRLDVSPSPRHMAEFERSILQYRALRPAMQQLGWPKYWHCAGYSRGYGRCQFYDVCHDHPGVTVEQWKNQMPPDGFIRSDVANPVYEVDL